MPLETRTRSRAPFAPQLDLPPPFALVTLREVGDAFAHAIEVAPAHGAGTLTYVGRFDLAEFAVVLEPEEPLRIARRAFYAAMTALTDALLAHAPPEKPITIDWPDAIRVDGGLVGGGRLAWPAGAPEDEPPDWLVFGGMIRMVSLNEGATGVNPLTAALEEEGFTDFAADALVESFARHLMTHIDAWQERGFGAVAQEYLQRLPREARLRSRIEESGDLVPRRAGNAEAERRDLRSALAAPSWFDPQARGPRA